VHHCTIQIDHQPDATIIQFIILTFIYSSTCFRHSPADHQELNDCSSSLWFYLRIVVIAVLWSWLGRLTGRTTKQHSYHHDMKVKPEAATAVELLMMGGRMPETSWAVNKCQDNKLNNCCIWLVIYLNHIWYVSFGKMFTVWNVWCSTNSCSCSSYKQMVLKVQYEENSLYYVFLFTIPILKFQCCKVY
jgi:hypothetical protein